MMGVVTRANFASVFVKLPVPRPRVVTCLHLALTDHISTFKHPPYTLPHPQYSEIKHDLVRQLQHPRIQVHPGLVAFERTRPAPSEPVSRLNAEHRKIELTFMHFCTMYFIDVAHPEAQ